MNPLKRIKNLLHIYKVSRLVHRSKFARFYTPLLLEYEQELVPAHWCDFFFISKYKGQWIPWNATMTTARHEYQMMVANKATEESFVKYRSAWEFEPVSDETILEFVNEEIETDAKRLKYCVEREQEIFGTDEVRVDPWTIHIDPDYSFGVGIHITVNEEFITPELVDRFIRLFHKYEDDVFDDMDKTPVSFTMDELGLVISDCGKYLEWEHDHMDKFPLLDMGVFDDWNE